MRSLRAGPGRWLVLGAAIVFAHLGPWALAAPEGIAGLVEALVAPAAARAATEADHDLARVFAPDSFWYTPLPREVPLNPDSENLAREFLRQLRAYYGHATINTGRYSAPIYVAGRDERPSAVAQWDCQKRGRLDDALARQWRAVPIPAYARPSDDSDAEMTIYQPATDTLWEFWKARRIDGRWQACWGGAMAQASKHDGIWPRPYGATATGLPLLGGLIRVDELRRGRIDHVMGISLVDVDNWTVVSWPANRSDGWNPSRSPHRIPEGLRFRLDPSVNVDALPLHPVAKIIAKAAQTYGFVVWDKGGAIALRAEDPTRFTVLGKPDPYVELWKGTPSYAILARFPWERLQFLPVNFGRR